MGSESVAGFGRGCVGPRAMTAEPAQREDDADGAMAPVVT